MKDRIAVTGIGIISSLGEGVETNYEALLAGRPGLGVIANLSTAHAENIKVGEVLLANNELANKLELPKGNAYSRTAMLGLLAARQALNDAGISPDHGNLGLVSATSVAGMDVTERFFYDYLSSDKNHHYIDAHHAGQCTEQIASGLGLKNALTSTISTACSSGANAIMFGAKCLQHSVLDKVIVGGTDALSKFTINGFGSLMILSPENNTPFDANRQGLNLGEGAAYLVLEREKDLEGKKIYGVVAGYGNTNDAHHQTASSPEGDGAYAAMNAALESAGISADQIDQINAHGTGTANNDLSEGRALLRTFNGKVPAFSSTKSFTGHTLAAAGAIEAVFSLLAIGRGKIFPTLGFNTPMPEFELTPETEGIDLKTDHILSNSLGFGGNCTSLVFAAAS